MMTLMPRSVQLPHCHPCGALLQRFNHDGGGLMGMRQPRIQRGGGALGDINCSFAGASLTCVRAGHGGGQTYQQRAGRAEQSEVPHHQGAQGLAVVPPATPAKSHLPGRLRCASDACSSLNSETRLGAHTEERGDAETGFGSL